MTSILALRNIKYWSSYRYFGLALAFLALRARNRIFDPVLWAEDGSYFLYQAYVKGLTSLIDFYGGYLHFIPRIFAWIAAQFSPIVVPFHFSAIFLSASAILIAAVCISYFLSENFENIISERWIRFLAVLGFALAPGHFEVLGNFANIHWFCSFFLFLLVIRKQLSKINPIEFFFAFLCIFSSGEAVILIPFFWFRLITQIKKNQYCCRSDGILFVGLIIAALMNLLVSQSAGSVREFPDLWRLLNSWVYGITNWVLFFPFFNYRLTSNIGRFVPVLSWVAFGAALYFLSKDILKNKHQESSSLLGFLSLYSISIILLMCLARGGGALNFFEAPSSYQWPNVGRYAFVLGPYAVLFWILFLKTCFKDDRYSRVVAIFLSFYVLTNCVSQYEVGRYNSLSVNWQVMDQEIAEAWKSKGAKRAFIQEAPEGWGFWFPPPGAENR